VGVLNNSSSVVVHVNRRAMLRLLLSGSGAVLLAACGGVAQPAAPPVSTEASASATASTPASAATSNASTASTVGTLNVTLADLGTENLDVIVAATNYNLLPLIYEPLLQYDSQGNLIPWLAESYSMSPDGKLWTFNLRRGVKWTSGDELTSDDVKFSIERYVSDASKSPYSPFHRQTVDHVEAPDQYTVQIYAKDPPYVFYADALALSFITPQKYFEKVGLDSFSKQPVGTGPWQLTKFTPSASAELTPNKDYWGTRKPVWGKLVLLQVPEESTRIAMLKRGEADIVGVSNDNAVTLRDTGGFQLRQTRSSTIPGLFLPGYWMQPGPTSDGRVREAMDTAINRQEIVDSFFKGFGKPAAGNLSLTELHWGFDPIWYTITYDPDRAKQLLQDAGYPGKFADPVIRIFSAVQGSAGWEPDLLQVISGYWDAVGIKTQIVPMDFTAMRSAWLAKDPKIMGGVTAWMSFGGGSASNFVPGQQNHYTSKGPNLGGNDPQLDKDYFAMVAELDPTTRLALWHKVQQEAFALHSVMGLVRIFEQYAVGDKVGEWTGADYLNNGFIVGLAGVQHR
jgi:peptide/nickel transport system substrate-binding protein